MHYREVRVIAPNRAGAIGLGVAALIIGGVLFALGLTLLLGIAVVGAVAATGVMLYRRLTGYGRTGMHRTRLDPSMEVFPVERHDAGRLVQPAPKHGSGSSGR